MMSLYWVCTSENASNGIMSRRPLKRPLIKPGGSPEYGISDGAHNLVGGFKDAGIVHHLDISHTLGNCMKHVYGKDPEFVSLLPKTRKDQTAISSSPTRHGFCLPI